MKLGKFINNEVDLIEVEDGMEVNGSRTEQELYANGYKKACLCHEDGETVWTEYPTCLVEELIPNVENE